MTKCSNLRQQIMDDVQRRYGEYLDKDKVSCITSKIAAAENKYPAKTTLASAIFYIKVDTQITSEGGKHFSGNAGGLSSPGGGVLFGDLYTDDLDDLYTNTVSFQITMTLYFVVYCFLILHQIFWGISREVVCQQYRVLQVAQARGPDALKYK